MLTFTDFALGGLLPGFLALLVTSLAWQPWRRWSIPREAMTVGSHASWAGPLAAALAYVVSQAALSAHDAGWSLSQSWPTLPPQTLDGWPLYAALFVGLVAVLFDAVEAPSFLRLGIMGLLMLGCAWVQASAAVLARWNTTGADAADAHRSAIIIGVSALLGTLALWLLLDLLTRRRSMAELSGVLFVVATGGAVVLPTSGSQKLGEYSGIISAALAGVAIAAVISPVRRYSRGIIALFVALFSQLLLRGYLAFDPLGSGLSLTCLVLLGAAALLAWAGLLQPLKRRRPWQRFLVEMALVAIPVAIAAWLSLRAFFANQSDMGM